MVMDCRRAWMGWWAWLSECKVCVCVDSDVAACVMRSDQWSLAV